MYTRFCNSLKDTMETIIDACQTDILLCQ